ncbi:MULTISPECIES: CHAT domain-containing protein [Agrobacterium]|uniref:CHAT domain-containing protein n=2 Tax=Agrobacterium tumefaciens complex TaxID=1183400 RepID=A0AAE6BJ93_AGRTU|nr:MULTISPECIES: CHAT domain-containing protein [Agrobacterium]ASK40727.1 hypothetical protein [Agrobacterium genomosp. 6]ASK41490.1 hypothetical protein [Agrobacterium genomosp. 6]QCL77478.1 CHAT domain-containing protein [Agrobacterium tumefaciens]QCL82966.1 CHAT domain-containing protein [Agrobacterium tumefaciens]CUX71676.1 hypothetical protein AGR6A_pTi0218 [Agrobacterium sp. NCPPB 925]
MKSSIISHEKSAFLKFELENGDARRRKLALQDLCGLYRGGFQLNAENRNSFEKTINGMVLSHPDLKVVRWCLNALARLARREESGRYIELSIAQYETFPEIVAAAVAALSRIYGGDLASAPSLKNVDPAIRTLAALQNTDPKLLDLNGFSINIDKADLEVLKLALITVGLNRDIENLFDPRHNNGTFVKALAQHDDPIVRQYSAWSVLENVRLTMADLGFDLQRIESQPFNVQAKLFQLAAQRLDDDKRRHEIILQGSYSKSPIAREGLAKGVQRIFYDGLPDITVNWFDLETDRHVRSLIAEHLARYADQMPVYEAKVFAVLEVEPNLKRNILLGAEGHGLYGKIKATELDQGNLSLFPADMDFKQRIHEINIGQTAIPEMKVLFLAASPYSSERLRPDEEAREIEDELKRVYHKKVEIVSERRWAVRNDQIQGAVLDFNPKVLHFSGHGTDKALVFENRNGDPVPVSSKAIAELVALSGAVECLVLNACFSSAVGQHCLAHVKWVIGCDASVLDEAAISFSKAFYRALAHGRSFDIAFRLAKNEVRIAFDDEADLYVLLAAD